MKTKIALVFVLFVSIPLARSDEANQMPVIVSILPATPANLPLLDALSSRNSILTRSSSRTTPIMPSSQWWFSGVHRN